RAPERRRGFDASCWNFFQMAEVAVPRPMLAAGAARTAVPSAGPSAPGDAGRRCLAKSKAARFSVGLANRQLRLPFVRGNDELPLPKPVRSAILPETAGYLATVGSNRVTIQWFPAVERMGSFAFPVIPAKGGIASAAPLGRPAGIARSFAWVALL